jgi:hypothetical protein
MKLARKFVSQIGTGQTVEYIVSPKMIQTDIIHVITQLVLRSVNQIGLGLTVQYIARSKMLQPGIIFATKLQD